MNTFNQPPETVRGGSTTRFVKVAPPTVQAGLGDALRQVFALDGEVRSLNGFEDLLTQMR